jgi:probable HAF family extracellular repeat protein
MLASEDEMTLSRKAFAVSALTLWTAVASAQMYRMIDISVGSPFNGTYAYGINNLGQITGTGTDPITGEDYAFIYQNGVYQNLGDFGYPYGADGDRINDAGQVAATGYGPGYNALLDSNGHAKKLGSIDGGYTVGLSLNSKGDIVGRGVNGDGGGQGFSYVGGHFSAMNVDLARGINDTDQIVGSVGYYWSYGGYLHGVEHAFVDTGGTITDIGDLGGGVRTNTEAYSINNAGEVTGYSTAADGTQHAFLYDGITMHDLGTFPPAHSCESGHLGAS